MKLDKLLSNVNFYGDISDQVNIDNITYDSRNVNSKSCFVAIKGSSFDGHEYIDAALDKDPQLVIIDNEKYFNNNKPIIKVDNSRKALSDISSNFFENPSQNLNIIGVTGTNGKTTVSYIVKKILDALGNDCSYLGTLGFMINNEVSSMGFTTPESLELNSMLKLIDNSGIKYSVMEVSSHSLDQYRVDSIDFNVAVFTNLTQDHLDYHKSMENYFATKSKLFNGLSKNGASIINIDDNYGIRLFNSIKENKTSYGFSSDADIYIKKIESSFKGTYCQISVFNEDFEFSSNLIGDYNIANILAAIGVIVSIGYKVSEVIDVIDGMILCVPGRMELISSIGQKYIYIDYAHTPDAYKKVFSTIKNIDKKQEIIVVFGCGGDRDRTKRSEMAAIVEKYCDKIFVTTDNPRFENEDRIINDIISGFRTKQYEIIKDRKIAIKAAIDNMSEKSILLVLGKGQDNYQVIKESKIFFSDTETIKKHFYAN